MDTDKEKRAQDQTTVRQARPDARSRQAPSHDQRANPSAAGTRLPPSRQGKKAVTAYVDPEMHKQLRLLGVELGKSSQEMIIEALDHYFERLESDG